MTEPMTLRVRAKAPLKKIHAALTEPAQLRTWLAEHAEVELPDRYAFWGRSTPGLEATQRLLHADDRSLRFVWRLDDIDTTVDIKLDEDGADATAITLQQSDMPSFADMLAGKGDRSLLHTFWALTLANLIDHVENRPLTPKPDLTSPVMREEVLIDATPRAVFASLTDGAAFSRWFGAHISIEPEVGGRWIMGSPDEAAEPVRIVELEPDRKLVLRSPDAQLTSWELAESDGKTRLTFVQSGFEPDNPPYGAWLGWLSGISELRRFHEVPDWRPIWQQVSVDGVDPDMLNVG
jgi:uncharacterized protein YndB with AHSA1/START domain